MYDDDDAMATMQPVWMASINKFFLLLYFKISTFVHSMFKICPFIHA